MPEKPWKRSSRNGRGQQQQPQQPQLSSEAAASLDDSNSDQESVASLVGGGSNESTSTSSASFAAAASSIIDHATRNNNSSSNNINSDSNSNSNSNSNANDNANSSTKRNRSDITATPKKGDDIRTPSPVEQGVTPYWKAVEERGGTTSPKLTRSAVKKKRQGTSATPRFREGAGEDSHAGAGAGGGEVLFFSPPDQEKNAEREKRQLRQREKERARRVANARNGGQLLEYDANGNPKFSLDVIRSPPQKKRHADRGENEEDEDDENQFFTDLSPSNHGGAADPPSAPSPAKKMEPDDANDRGTSSNGSNGSGGGNADYERNVMSELAELKQMMCMASQQSSSNSNSNNTNGGSNDNDDDDRAETMAAMKDLIAKNEKNVALCAVYEERTRTLQSTIDQLRGELSDAQIASGDQEKELTSRIDELKEDCQEKAREIGILSQKLMDNAVKSDEEKDVLAKRCSQLEAELNEAKTSLNEMEWKIGSVEEALQEAKDAQGRLEDRLEESAREKLSLELEKNDLQKKVAQITRDADVKMESRAAELELATSKSSEAEEKVAQYEGEIVRLREENAKAAAFIAEQNAAAYDEKLSTMEQQNSQLLKELDETKAELQKVEDDAGKAMQLAEDQKKDFDTREDQLNTIISNLEAELKNLKAGGDESKAEKEDLEKRLIEAEQELASLKVKHAAVEKSISSEKKQSALRLEEFEAMRRELELAKRQISDLERNTNESTQVIASLQQEKSEASKKLIALKKSYDESKDEAKLVKEANAALEDQRNRLESNMSMLQDDKAGLAKRLETFDERESELLRKLTVMEEKRRCLHNRVMQLAGNIRVFVRVRPVITAEQHVIEGRKRKHEHQDEESPFNFPGVCDRDLSPSSTASSSSSSSADDMTKNVLELTEPYKDRGGLSARRKKWRFGFDGVFAQNHGQEDVWEGTEPLVQSAIDGHNVCLFAYGQTGSGKSFTMIGDDQNEGIIYRAVRKLFAAKQDIEIESSASSTVEISVEMLEIYNEKLRDLLSKDMDELQIKTNSSNDPVVDNILMAADSVDEVLQILEFAKERRCVRATNSNAESSRSHLVFTIHFSVQTPNYTRAGKLHVCDLAGSERLSKSGSTGTLLKETKAINTSLSCLSNVIESLQGGNSHVPFRDSKLTHLLKDSLGGDSKTLAIVCCNPLPDHFNESLCSIRFAAKASRVELKSQNNFSA